MDKGKGAPYLNQQLVQEHHSRKNKVILGRDRGIYCSRLRVTVPLKLCISYTFQCCDKMPDKGNIRKEKERRFVLAYLQFESISVGRSWQQECEAAAHIGSSQEAER